MLKLVDQSWIISFSRGWPCECAVYGLCGGRRVDDYTRNGWWSGGPLGGGVWWYDEEVVVCGGRREVEEGGEPREVVCGGGDEEVQVRDVIECIDVIRVKGDLRRSLAIGEK
ncbi:hypothetical protein Tco_0782070 [Tanacetum coccineum]